MPLQTAGAFFSFPSCFKRLSAIHLQLHGILLFYTSLLSRLGFLFFPVLIEPMGSSEPPFNWLGEVNSRLPSAHSLVLQDINASALFSASKIGETETLFLRPAYYNDAIYEEAEAALLSADLVDANTLDLASSWLAPAPVPGHPPEPRSLKAPGSSPQTFRPLDPNPRTPRPPNANLQTPRALDPDRQTSRPPDADPQTPQAPELDDQPVPGAPQKPPKPEPQTPSNRGSLEARLANLITLIDYMSEWETSKTLPLSNDEYINDKLGPFTNAWLYFLEIHDLNDRQPSFARAENPGGTIGAIPFTTLTQLHAHLRLGPVVKPPTGDPFESDDDSPPSPSVIQEDRHRKAKAAQGPPHPPERKQRAPLAREATAVLQEKMANIRLNDPVPAERRRPSVDNQDQPDTKPRTRSENITVGFLVGLLNGIATTISPGPTPAFTSVDDPLLFAFGSSPERRQLRTGSYNARVDGYLRRAAVTERLAAGTLTGPDTRPDDPCHIIFEIKPTPRDRPGLGSQLLRQQTAQFAAWAYSRRHVLGQVFARYVQLCY